MLKKFPTLVILKRKSVEERGPFVVPGPCETILRHFGPRRTRCVPDLRQSVRRGLGLCNLRGQVGCGCWRDTVVSGDYRRRSGLKRCIPNEQQRNQPESYKCQKGESGHFLSHSLQERP